MQTRGDLIQKRPRISTYLSESFSAICWIFSETFWLSKCSCECGDKWRGNRHRNLATPPKGRSNGRFPATQGTGLRFLAGGIGKDFKTPALLSIYVSKKRAPWPLAYLSISQKNGRLTFLFFIFYFLFFLLRRKNGLLGPVSPRLGNGGGVLACYSKK